MFGDMRILHRLATALELTAMKKKESSLGVLNFAMEKKM
jgi:hypothetical protein